MKNLLERILIEKCAPTLAGLKTGNVFNYRIGPGEDLKSGIEHLKKVLAYRGVYVTVLRQCGCKALLYVFREKRLAEDLCDPKTAGVLKDVRI